MTSQSIHNFQDVGIDPTRKKEIAMPPLATENQSEPKQPEYQVHPEIAKEFPPQQQMEAQEEEAVVEQKEADPESVEQPDEKPLETPNSKNIRFLREKAQRAEQAERERDALLQRLAQIEANKTNTQVQQVESETNLDPDDFVNAKYLNKYDKKITELNEKLQRYEQNATVSSVDAQIRSRYPDFEKVVSKDNIQMLKQEYPEIAATLNANPDLYSKAVTAYELMKKLGINTEDIYLDDKIKVQRNQAKPKPSNSIAPTKGDSPLSKANGFATGLTDDVRKALWKEMQEAKRNI